jgi:hypothetical protein
MIFWELSGQFHFKELSFVSHYRHRQPPSSSSFISPHHSSGAPPPLQLDDVGWAGEYLSAFDGAAAASRPPSEVTPAQAREVNSIVRRTIEENKIIH